MTAAGRLADALPGAELFRLAPLHGGDLSEVQQAELTDGRRVVVKRGPLVALEARMLSAMATSGARVPEVLGVDGDLLVMEWMEPARASSEGWRACGANLRQLHNRRGEVYGWPEDYAFGRVPIRNLTLADWPTFWAERRLLPFSSHLSKDLSDRLERLSAGLGNHLPSRPAKALLHGDLWSGNVHFTGSTAALIDPACYFGDAEVDLAMLDLFGAIPAPFLDGYGPVAPGWETRRPIYQLWPALVHLRLFGGGYLGMVESLIERAERA